VSIYSPPEKRAFLAEAPGKEVLGRYLFSGRSLRRRAGTSLVALSVEHHQNQTLISFLPLPNVAIVCHDYDFAITESQTRSQFPGSVGLEGNIRSVSEGQNKENIDGNKIL
jgi:hypothetical protein